MSQYHFDAPLAGRSSLWSPVRPGAPVAVSATYPASRGSLPARLTALARLIQIGSARAGPDGFDLALLREAEELLARAGERLRLSAEHTVVILAGGTGSGKSALFNALAGADLSPVGVTRPMTSAPHACVTASWQRQASNVGTSTAAQASTSPSRAVRIVARAPPSISARFSKPESPVRQ